MRPDPRDRKPPRKPSLRPGGGSRPIDRERILAVAETVAAAQGCELLERSVSDSRRIRLVVDREDSPPDTKLLVALIRALRDGLTEAGIDPGAFDIEFDSPGENRVLETARHFERFAGERVRVSLAAPDEEGRSAFLAVLVGADGDSPRVREEGGDERTLPRDAWRRIRLAPPANRGQPRPTPKGKQRKQARKAKRSR
ncbi:MAG: ribosome maturation factor RimP [Planctomycetota bacterium JB042]